MQLEDLDRPRLVQELQAISTLTTQRLDGGDLLSRSLGVSCQPPSEKQPTAVERRVAWLEEDVAVIVRRLQESGEGSQGDAGFCAVAARLDEELAVERHKREALEERVFSLEVSLRKEHEERESQLRGFSGELEQTVREIIARLDEGLQAGAQAMRERSDQTEARLRTLIQRVDEGLSASAAALQDTLSSASQGIAPPSEPQQSAQRARSPERARPKSPERARPSSSERWMGVASSDIDSASSEAASRDLAAQASVENSMKTSDQLIESWDRLRQENIALREQRAQAQLHRLGSPLVAQARTVVPTCVTASLTYPCTLQVPGNGLLGGAWQPGAGRGCATSGVAMCAGPSQVAVNVPGHSAVAVNAMGNFR